MVLEPGQIERNIHYSIKTQLLVRNFFIGEAVEDILFKKADAFTLLYVQAERY